MTLLGWFQKRRIIVPHRLGFLLLSLLMLLFAVAIGDTKTSDTNFFDYDPKTPIEIEELGAYPGDSLVNHEITYSSKALDREVGAYLVVPTGEGPFPAVVFLHKYPGDKDQFLDEAKMMAKMGVVSLLVEGYFPWRTRPKNLEADRQSIRRQIIELRRAVDVLASRSDVDPKRIAFVGMDYGAMHGSVLAGVEKRIKAFVLIVPTHRYINWNSLLNGDTFTMPYRKGMQSLDPISYISQASAPVLFQFSNADRFVAEEDALQLYTTAKEPKNIQWYKGDHEVSFPMGQNDRLEWLRGQLKLAPVEPDK